MHPTPEGKGDGFVVLDTGLRSIAGWSIDSGQAAALAANARGIATSLGDHPPGPSYTR